MHTMFHAVIQIDHHQAEVLHTSTPPTSSASASRPTAASRAAMRQACAPNTSSLRTSARRSKACRRCWSPAHAPPRRLQTLRRQAPPRHRQAHRGLRDGGPPTQGQLLALARQFFLKHDRMGCRRRPEPAAVIRAKPRGFATCHLVEAIARLVAGLLVPDPVERLAFIQAHWAAIVTVTML